MNRIKQLAMTLTSLSTLAFQPILAQGFTVVEDQMTESIRTPSLQEVKRVKIRLDNGLEAFIVSDPSTPKSGAALSVGVGQQDEPFDQVGLAHFVEHMLFLGTEKYPIEKEYQEFISENGGSSNAYTSTDRTVYMFDINNAQMSEALDRFGAFFSKPLFNTSGLERERQAVDQEFSYRAVLDPIRNYLVFLDQMNPESHHATWRCGNHKTLSSISRDQLVQWYEENYGSDRMKLAIYSHQPIEEIQKQVVEIFSEIKPSKVPSIKEHVSLVNPQSLGHTFYVKPIKDVRSMMMAWEVDSKFVKDFDYQVMNLVGSALTDEYPGSLATYLKDKGWIQSLSASGFNLTQQQGFFMIDAELTEQGVLHKDQIVEKVYQALTGMRQQGVPRYRFEEMVNVAKLNYQYQSRPNIFNYLPKVCSGLHYESLETYPMKHSWPTQFSQELNREFIASLQPEKALYILSAPQHLLDVKYDMKEKVAAVDYTKEKIAASKLQAWANIQPDRDLAIAPPNPYVPDHIALVKNPKQYETPSLLLQEDKGALYYQADSSYLVPNVLYTLRIHSPEFAPSAQTEVYKDFYTLAFQDGSAEQADQGQVAGMSHYVQFDSNFALNMTVSGYSQKSGVYFSQLLNTLKTHRPTKDQFERYKEALKVNYENQAHKQPSLSQAKELVVSLMVKEYVSADDKLAALNQISYEDVQSFYDKAFQSTYINSYFYGNLQPEDAKDLYQVAQSCFQNSAAYPKDQHQRRSIVDFSKNSSPKYVAKSTAMEGNAAFLMIGQGDMTFKKMAALSVYANSVSTPFFDTLRTKQQTGYVVQSASQEIERQLFSFFMVLSNSHSTRDLLARFELFNEEFLKAINTHEYSEAKFEAIKNSIITQLQQPPKNLYENGLKQARYAFDYNADFEFNQKQIEGLNELSYEEFVSYVEKYFGRNNPSRIAGLVDGKLLPENQLEYTPIVNLPNYKTQLIYTSANMNSDQNKESNNNGI